MTVLYFAWVRQKIGVAEETLALPEGVKNVADMAAHLRARGAGYAEALADVNRVRAAVNREHVSFDAAVNDGDEIAFFPPVTGG
ncbi:MAG TPA: molybdopterin converting factor subunit 1 [Rhizomicrobium sp.]